MAQPTKKQLVRAIAELQSINQQMFGAYSNDVAPNRADRMDELRRKSDNVAQPIIDAFPYEYLDGGRDG